MLKNLYAFGEYLGKIYQLTDDLLDVQGNSKLLGKDVGVDAKANKLSAISVYGEEKCLALLQEYQEKANAILKEMPVDSQFFQEFLEYLISRKK